MPQKKDLVLAILVVAVVVLAVLVFEERRGRDAGQADVLGLYFSERLEERIRQNQAIQDAFEDLRVELDWQRQQDAWLRELSGGRW